MDYKQQLSERLRRKMNLGLTDDQEMLDSDPRLVGGWKPQANTQFVNSDLTAPAIDRSAQRELEMKYRMPDGLPTASEIQAKDGEYQKNPEDPSAVDAMDLMREKMNAETPQRYARDRA